MGGVGASDAKVYCQRITPQSYLEWKQWRLWIACQTWLLMAESVNICIIMIISAGERYDRYQADSVYC